MWSGNLRRQIVVLMLLPLCFQAKSSVAQQVPAGSAAVAAKDAGAQTQASAAQEKPSGGGRLKVGNNTTPIIQPEGVRVLRDGEKLPERKVPAYEDWGGPQLPSAGMKAEAVPLGVAKRDGFTREIWHVQWREMDPIDLWVIMPSEVKSPPVVLYLYSYDVSDERYKNDDFCKFLTRDGFAAVGFVSAVTEQRLHDRPMRDTFVSVLQESLSTTTHDVQMVLNFLERRGDMDMNRVGMWADGSGAGVAIMASAVDARIKALDLLDPWGDWPDWLAKSSIVREDRRAEYLRPFFLEQVSNLDPLQYFPKVKAQNVRLQYIKEGVSVTPEIVREKMEAAAPAHAEIVHYEDRKAFVAEVSAKGIGFDWIKANASVSNPKSQTRDRTKPPVGRVEDSKSQ